MIGLRPSALRRHTSGTAALLALALTAAVAPVGHAPGEVSDPRLPGLGLAAASCAPASNLLTHAPVTTALPGGATLRIWQRGTGTSAGTLRIAAVSIPAATLSAHVYTSGAVTRHRTVAAQASGHAQAVAVINAGVFDTGGVGAPVGHVLTIKGVTKLDRTSSSTVSVTPQGQAALAQVIVRGSLTTPNGVLKVSGVNATRVATSGISVYTPSWGNRTHPAGSIEVLLSGDQVASVRGAGRGKAVPAGRIAVTATGAAATALRRLAPGTAVTLRFGASTTWQHTVATPADPTLGAVELVDVGARVLRDGAVVTGGCSGRNEIRRPRSGIGWRADGTTILITIAGTNAGAGGATGTQVGMYLKQLGAVDGSKLDGGGSTTLLVRTQLGGQLVRVDTASKSAAQRAVANSLAFEAP